MRRFGMAVRVAIAIGCVWTCGCSGRRTLATSEPSPRETPSAVDSTGDAVGAEPSPQPPPEPPLDEAAARAVLAERFRAAGYRVLFDVRVGDGQLFDVTLDGYDPTLKVGFEYVAVEERDSDLVAAERGPLDASEHVVLVVDAAGEADVRARADRFLASNPR